METINLKQELSICVHPNALKSSSWQVCPDCQKQCGCIVDNALCYIEAMVSTSADGEPDLSSITTGYYVPDTAYYCEFCREDFRDWDRLLDHIRSGTA